MAPRYKLSRDYHDSDGLVSYSPHWVLAFARYANQVTYSPSSRSSVDGGPDFAYSKRDALILDDLGDCVALTVSSNKRSHTASLQATLLDSGTRYLNEIMVGDWVLAFMVYSEDEFRKLSQNLRAGVKVNGWESGLKFVGRVKDLRKNLSVQADGHVQSSYTLSCSAFSEFDSTILYYPEMRTGSEGIPVSQDQFGSQVSKMVRGEDSDERGSLDPNRLIPRLMTVIFGHGAWADLRFRDSESRAPNMAYIVPRDVCSWLGVDSPKPNFSDLMRVMVGVQKYSKGDSVVDANSKPGEMFWPDGAVEAEEGYKATFPLTGSYPQEVVPQTTSTPWAFITNYVGGPVNEALVTLRPDSRGDIFPFLTVRQTPFTSEVGSQFSADEFNFEKQRTVDKNGNAHPVEGPEAPTFSRFPTTRFMELPRWVIHDGMLAEASLGRSDDLRQNLVYVYGTGPGVAMDESDQFVRSGPIKDDLDILRNGIRPYMPSVNCFLKDLVRAPTDWRELMADIVMGQHLTLNGTVLVYGIRAPIAPGDNVEFQRTVYHVESVVHSCSIAAGGGRSFTSSLALSRGLDVVASVDDDPVGNRAAAFPNMSATDRDKLPVAAVRD